MARPTQRQASFAVLVVALLLGAPACAAPVTGAGGLPVQRVTAGNPYIAEAQDGACKGPPGKRVVAFNLAPQTTLVDLVAWISSVVCEPFLLPGTIATENKTLTTIAPERMTREQAYRFFLGALDSVGLTVERAGQLQRIVEIGATPPRTAEIEGVKDRTAEPDGYVTVLLHLQTPAERVRVFGPCEGEVCRCVVFPPDSDTVIITDRRSVIERLLRPPVRPFQH